MTLPVFPETVDSIDQLLRGFFRVGTLDRGGWERWFLNSTHPKTDKLLRNLEFVSNVQEGLSNITNAFFWPYAFLGSTSQLEYIVQSNYTMETMGKRSALHISDECFSFFGVSFVFPSNSVYKSRFNDAILRFQSSGLITKVLNEVSWEMQRSSSGRLLQASNGKTNVLTQEERGLTVADTEGMFLLLGIGFLIGGSVLLSEWVGGCTNKCRQILKKRRDDHDIEVNKTIIKHPHATNSGRSNASSSVNKFEENDSRSSIVSVTSSKLNQTLNERCHKRSVSVFEANLNNESLLELYHGPRRRHSTIIVMNGKMISESDASNHTTGSERNLREIEFEDKKKSVEFLDKMDEDHDYDDDGVHRVQVNRPPTPFNMLSDIDEAFGEKVQ